MSAEHAQECHRGQDQGCLERLDEHCDVVSVHAEQHAGAEPRHEGERENRDRRAGPCVRAGRAADHIRPAIEDRHYDRPDRGDERRHGQHARRGQRYPVRPRGVHAVSGIGTRHRSADTEIVQREHGNQGDDEGERVEGGDAEVRDYEAACQQGAQRSGSERQRARQRAAQDRVHPTAAVVPSKVAANSAGVAGARSDGLLSGRLSRARRSAWPMPSTGSSATSPRLLLAPLGHAARTQL